MSYIGDIRLGNTIDTKFCTVQSTGAPTTLSSSPVISCYVGNSTTELTAGITLTVDFDSRTGLNNVRVVATGGNGYATATDNQLVITTGTVNSVSAVGYVVAQFSIENRSALMSATAANKTLVVDANGLADANMVKAGPTGSGTAQTAGDLKASMNTLQADTDDIQTRIPAALVGGRMDSSIGAMAAAVLTAAAIAADAITAAKIADGAIDRATFAADTGLQTVRSNTAQAGAASTITLDASASAVDSFYVGQLVYLTGGTGVGQIRVITGYVGATKVATLSRAWATNPDNTTTFALVPIDTNKLNSSLEVVTASVSAGGIIAASFGVDAIDSVALAASAASEIVTAIFARVFGSALSSKTFDAVISAIFAAVAGVTTGAGSGTEVFKGSDGSTTLVTTTNDGTNRTGSTIA